MFTRRNASAKRLGLRNIERREIDEARRSKAAAAQAMLDAMRVLGFEAYTEIYTAQAMTDPDATAEQKHRTFQEMERIAFADLPAE